MKRRTFVIGGLSSASLLALSACTPSKTVPSPSQPPPSTKTPGPIPSLSQPRMPKPKAFNRTSWSTDPFARGSRSYLAAGSYPEERGMLGSRVGERIYFAGEATSAELPGTVAGAAESGERVAAELLANTPAGERIAVIGAGIAGATAARLLANAGYDVTVLEARDRVGGRIQSVVDSAWPVPIERGAAFVPTQDAPGIQQQLTALGIATTPFGAQQEIRTGSGTTAEPADIGKNAVEKALRWATTNHADVSLNVALARSGATKLPETPDAADITPSEWLQHYLDTQIVPRYGADPREISAINGIAQHPEGGQKDFVLGRYDTVVSHKLENLDVWLSTVVTHVSQTDKGVGIRFLTGESLQVNRVVVTVPLGVLKSADISFDPPLPYGHQLAIAAIGMGVVDKLWLAFDEPFWDTNDSVWSVVGSSNDFLEWHNLQPITGVPVLVGITAAGRARRLAELSDEDVVSRAVESLRPFRALG